MSKIKQLLPTRGMKTVRLIMGVVLKHRVSSADIRRRRAKMDKREKTRVAYTVNRMLQGC